MKIINAFAGMGDPMNEKEMKNFMANKDNSLLIRGLIDEKGEPNASGVRQQSKSMKMLVTIYP